MLKVAFSLSLEHFCFDSDRSRVKDNQSISHVFLRDCPRSNSRDSIHRVQYFWNSWMKRKSDILEWSRARRPQWPNIIPSRRGVTSGVNLFLARVISVRVDGNASQRGEAHARKPWEKISGSDFLREILLFHFPLHFLIRRYILSTNEAIISLLSTVSIPFRGKNYNKEFLNIFQNMYNICFRISTRKKLWMKKQARMCENGSIFGEEETYTHIVSPNDSIR